MQRNLLKTGLMLKRVPSTVGNSSINYTLVYAPWDVLASYAEVMSLRMPMKTIQSNLKYLFDDECNLECKTFTTVFSRKREYLFAIPELDREEFFSPSQRGEIIEYILRRTSFNKEHDVFSIGISKMLSDGIYEAAYPLHDVTNECKHETGLCAPIRCQLKNQWASMWCILRLQPLNQVVNYFGVKIGMYYAWTGFYTYMLLTASLLGVLTVLYGSVTIFTDATIKEQCNFTSVYPVCPACPINCNYTQVSDSCTTAKVMRVSRNTMTIVFAMCISLWASLFLELWKRYSATISYKWDLSDFNNTVDEYPRPEFLAQAIKNKAKVKTRLNPINRVHEPHISFFRGRLLYYVISFSFVLCCIMLALSIMVSIIVYRVSFQISFKLNRKALPESLQAYSTLLVTMTAATLNLFGIIILSIIYRRIAYYLTELEMHRTQFEFDNSLTLKMYLFEFFNYYSSFFYIAFIQGKMVATPPDGSLQIRSNFTKYLIESCSCYSCYMDLTIQLVIIFIGKAAISALVEHCTPYFYRVYNKYQYVNQKQDAANEIRLSSLARMDTEWSSNGELSTRSEIAPRKLPQWEEDYLLESWDENSLFYEYLKLIIQFGFITIFVVAFPLAPLFALISNVFEIRLDAQKMLTSYKRPVAQR